MSKTLVIRSFNATTCKRSGHFENNNNNQPEFVKTNLFNESNTYDMDESEIEALNENGNEYFSSYSLSNTRPRYWESTTVASTISRVAINDRILSNSILSSFSIILDRVRNGQSVEISFPDDFSYLACPYNNDSTDADININISKGCFTIPVHSTLEQLLSESSMGRFMSSRELLTTGSK